MRIRPFRAEDLPVLQEITVEAFDGVSIDQGMERLFGTIRGRDWRWRKARQIADDAARDPGGIFVAEIEDRTVGYVTTWIDPEAGIGHIPHIAFVPECRGQGLGRRLLEFALERFRRLGLSHAKIETLVQNDVGRHLYESLGFREVARQVHFLADLNESGSQSGDQGVRSAQRM